MHLAGVRGRRGPDGRAERANQMGLIGKAQLDGQVRLVDDLVGGHPSRHIVQPAPLDHPLRARAHVLGKDPLQAAHRQAGQLGHLPDPDDLAISRHGLDHLSEVQRRLVRLWLNLATSFSLLPLRLAVLAGAGMAMVGSVGAIVTIAEALINRNNPSGWASTMTAILLVSGVQSMILGVLGEYVGRTLRFWQSTLGIGLPVFWPGLAKAEGQAAALANSYLTFFYDRGTVETNRARRLANGYGLAVEIRNMPAGKQRAHLSIGWARSPQSFLHRRGVMTVGVNFGLGKE